MHRNIKTLWLKSNMVLRAVAAITRRVLESRNAAKP